MEDNTSINNINNEYIIFPESIEDNIKSEKIDLSKLNIYQRKVVIQSYKMLQSKKYVYIFGGGHGTNSKTNFSTILTKDNIKTAGAPTRKTKKLSYEANPSFYDNLNWENNNFYYGLDCSGFIYACYNLAGIKINCSLAASYPKNNNFKEISKEELKAGDIISYSFGHVIMFLGFCNVDGIEKYYCIHAPDSGKFLKTGYYKIENGIPLTYVPIKKNFIYEDLCKSIISYFNFNNYFNDKIFPYLIDSFPLFKRYFFLMMEKSNIEDIFNIYYYCFLPLISFIFQSSTVYLNDEEYSLSNKYVKLINDIEINNKIKNKLSENNEFYINKIKLIKNLINLGEQEKVTQEIISIIKVIFDL